MGNQEKKLEGSSSSIINKIIDASVGNRLIMFVFIGLILVFGCRALLNIKLDAVPDLSDTQVIIKTKWSGQDPKLIEDLITYRISSAMLGLPKVKAVRGYSMFSTSFVYVVFEDKVDQYWARSRVLESLFQINNDLPSGAVSEIGPDATGVGWIYQYALVDESGLNNLDLADLRQFQDDFLKAELESVDGVSEVASVGGFTKEYQIFIDPHKLRLYNISLSKLIMILRQVSQEVGGRVIEQSEMEYIIRSKGYIQKVQDLSGVAVGYYNNNPILLSQIANIKEGSAFRRGATELNGTGEVVSGIVIMRSGENALRVINNVKKKIDELENSLPDGIKIMTTYDRAPLIQGAVKYLWSKLIEESLVVVLICFIFLWHFRASLIIILSIIFGVLLAFIVMERQGLTANIMSLGGIAITIGVMVDGAIIMIENAIRKISVAEISSSKVCRDDSIISAVKEVAPGIFFSLLIIIVSFIPIFFLSGHSAKLFFPLAFTKSYVMIAATILSITIIPVLMIYLLKGRIIPEDKVWINRRLIKYYFAILTYAMKHKISVCVLAGLMLFSSIFPFMKTGSEFMPALYEGEILYMPTTLPNISSSKAQEVLSIMNRMIKQFPEVEQVFGKVGRADTATDPAPMSMIETWIKLKDKSEWRDGYNIKKIISELNKEVKIPGFVNSWGYPIKIRTDMVSTGIRTPVGIKVAGNSLDTIDQIMSDLESNLKEVEGTRSIISDSVSKANYLIITPNRKLLSEFNIDYGRFQQSISILLGGMKLSDTIQGRSSYDIIMRYDNVFRESINDVRNLFIENNDGKYIPLHYVAEVDIKSDLSVIKSENGRLSGWVFIDLETTDITKYVRLAKEEIANNMNIPAGYSINFVGQFEELENTKQKLLLVIPIASLIIILLLIIHFQSALKVALVLITIPLVFSGAIWLIYALDYNFSVAVVTGFIALSGIVIETAIIMLMYLDQQIEVSKPKNLHELEEAVMKGAVLRLRPKLMTVLTVIIGLVPVFLVDGLGADITRRIAIPMLGGMLSTLFIVLIFLPVLFVLGRKKNYFR